MGREGGPSPEDMGIAPENRPLSPKEEQELTDLLHETGQYDPDNVVILRKDVTAEERDKMRAAQQREDEVFKRLPPNEQEAKLKRLRELQARTSIARRMRELGLDK